MPGVPDAKVQEMIAVLSAADRFIPGLLDSSAGVDLDSRTVLWENTFVDEASYSGPYMVHPYHIGAIDNYVMPDSPECITDNTYATRYTTPDTSPVLYTITARTTATDADAYVDLLERHYDPFMVEGGCPLLNRWRTVDQGYLEAEVHSTWQIDSLSAYSDLRTTTIADPHWTAFVNEAMPLVQGGSRRFHRAI